MPNQKRVIISLLFTIILILLTISAFLTLIVFFISSEAMETWQSPEINPYTLFNVSPPSNDISLYTPDDEELYQFCTSLGDIHIDKDCIGLFHDGKYTIALVDQGDKIIQLVSGYNNTWQYLLEPECLGILQFDEGFLGRPEIHAGITLYRIELQIPDAGYDQKNKCIDICDVWSENGWDCGGNKNFLHTEGRFYVDYGRSVIHGIDKSYSVTTPFFNQYQDCRTEIGHGNAVGWINANTIWSLRSFPINTKFSADSWITVDMYSTTHLGISNDKWISTALPGKMDRGK